MLIQLQHQKIDDLKLTDLVAQGEPPKEVTAEKLGEFVQGWLKDVAERHPLPEGYQWLVCTEDSEYFKYGRIIADALKSQGIEVDERRLNAFEESQIREGE